MQASATSTLISSPQLHSLPKKPNGNRKKLKSGETVIPCETISGFSPLRFLKNCYKDGINGAIMQMTCLLSRHPRLISSCTYIPRMVCDELSNLERLTRAFQSAMTCLEFYLPPLKVIDESSPGVMIKYTLSGSKKIYCHTFGLIPGGLHYLYSGFDNMARAIEILSESTVDSIPILNDLKISMKHPIQQYLKRNPDLIRKLCADLVKKEVKWLQQVLSKQEKTTCQANLISALHQNYKYSEQNKESRAFQLYDILISKIYHDMASTKNSYIPGILGWSFFNGINKQGQSKYRADINRIKTSVRKQVIHRLKEQGLSDQKIVMALILYASRDKSYDSLYSLYRESIINVCKLQMEKEIKKEFDIQVGDIYPHQDLASKKIKHPPANKEKPSTNGKESEDSQFSIQELDTLLASSCEKDPANSIHLHRTYAQGEPEEISPGEKLEISIVENSETNDFEEIQDIQTTLPELPGMIDGKMGLCADDQDSAYSVHYYRKQVKEEPTKIKTKGKLEKPEKDNLKNYETNGFEEVHESEEILPESLAIVNGKSDLYANNQSNNVNPNEILNVEDKKYWQTLLVQNGFQKGSEQFSNINHCLEDLIVKLNWDSNELKQKALSSKLKIIEETIEIELPVYHVSHGKNKSDNGATLIFSRVNNRFELLAVAKHSGLAKGETSYRCLWPNPAYRVPRNFSTVVSTTPITKREA